MKYVVVEKAMSHKYKGRTGGPGNWHYTYEDEGIGEKVTKPLHQNIKELGEHVERNKKLDKLLEQQKAEEFVEKLSPKMKERLTSRVHTYDTAGVRTGFRKWVKTPFGDVEL